MHTILTKLTLVSFVKMLVDVIRIYFVNSNTSVQFLLLKKLCFSNNKLFRGDE